MKKLLTWVAVIFLFATCSTKPVDPPAPLLPIPSDAQLAWHEMETNAFIHFTINTFTDKEWGYGDESPKLFNPTNLNTDQWVSTLKEAGFKTIILTCKHHDGFCLWPSAFTDHSIGSSPYKNGKGNLVKELSTSVAKAGLKFGIYVSPWDRNRSDYGQPSYITYYRNQLNELFNENKPIVEMWFDGANGGDGFYGGAREKRMIDKTKYYDWPTTLSMVREKEPEIIFFSDAGPGVRWVGNEKGSAGITNWSTITPDTLYAGQAGIEELLNTGSENGTKWIPAEVDVSIRPGWFYHEKEDSLVKTPEQLFDIYLTSVGRGSTLLLNVPPDKTGRIHPNDVKALQGWRKLIDGRFKTNLAVNAKITASETRGESARYHAANLADEKKETYWATDDGVTKATIEFEMSKKENVNFIVIQEYIKLGQRIKTFKIEAWKDGAWIKAEEGTTVGYKRIVRLFSVATEKIRITFTGKACPVISEVGIY